MTPRQFVIGASVATAVLCLVEWLAAHHHVPVLSAELAHMPRIVPATAVLLVGDAGALALTTSRKRWPSVILAALVAAANLVVLFGATLAPERTARLLTGLLWERGVPSPDTMTAGCLIALAIASVSARRRRLSRVGHVLALLAIAIGIFVLIAHLFHARVLYSLSVEVGMSPVAALVVVLLGVGALSVTPRHGLMRILFSSSEGGRLARRFLPFVFGAPLLMAALVAYGLNHGLYTYRAEIALLLVAVIYTLGAASWRHARNVNAAEARLDRQVRERTQQLTETIAEIEEFSQTLAHDVRGPLINLREFLALVLEEHGDALSAEVRDHLARASRAGRRLDRLTLAILRYGELSRRPFQLRRVDTAAVVRRVCDGLRPGVDPRTLVIESGLVDVWADEQALHDILRELLDNAVRFVRPATPPQVRIGGEVNSLNLRLLVRDEGIGVRREHQDLIFRPFQQLARSDEHAGIGLALVRRAVTKMNGRVGVESDGTRGSMFWVELPRPGKGRPGG